MVAAEPKRVQVFWPASRSRAATRALLWAACAFLLGFAALVVYRQLYFGPSVAGSILVTYSIAIAALPLPILAVVTAVAAFRWFAFALWPGRVGIFADERELSLRFGPFGSRSFDSARLDVRYPFELSGDFEDGGFEAFLPEEHQLASFLPRMTHPNAREGICPLILRFATGTEAEIAAALRPATQHWRADRL